MYKITAIVRKNYQAQINWTSFSKTKMTKSEAIKLLSKLSKDSYGHGVVNQVDLENFKCVRV